MNATQAMLLAAPEKTYGSAAVLACNLKRKLVVQQGIKQDLEASELGFENRADVLGQIMNNPHIGKTVSLSVRDGEGRTILTKQSGPSWGNILKAVEIGNKLSGDYERSKREDALAEDEYQRICKRLFKEGKGKSGPTVSAPKPKSDVKTTDMQPAESTAQEIG